MNNLSFHINSQSSLVSRSMDYQINLLKQSSEQTKTALKLQITNINLQLKQMSYLKDFQRNSKQPRSYQEKLFYENRHITPSHKTQHQFPSKTKNNPNINTSQSNILDISVPNKQLSKNKPSSATTETNKPVKTIKLRPSFKSQPSQNKFEVIMPHKNKSKFNQKLNYNQNIKDQRYILHQISNYTEFPSKFFTRQSISKSTNSNLKSNVTTPNTTALNNLEHATNRCSFSPLRKNIDSQLKLKNILQQEGYSLKDNEDIFVRFQNQKSKIQLLQQQIAKITKEKEEIVKTLKQKEIVIQTNQCEIRTLKLQFQLKFQQQSQNLKNYEEEIQILKTKLELNYKNRRLQQSKEIQFFYNQKVNYFESKVIDFQEVPIGQLYSKNRSLMKFDQIVNQNYLNRNPQNNKLSQIENYQNFGRFSHQTSKIIQSQLLDEKISIIIQQSFEKDFYKPPNPYKQKVCKDDEIKCLNLSKRKSLLDMNEVMSVDWMEESFRNKSQFEEFQYVSRRRTEF